MLFTFTVTKNEGFGLPVLEALACGIPIAVSNSSSLPEVAGGFAHYFDPRDIKSMSRGIFLAINDKTDYHTRLRRNNHATKFSWDFSAGMMLKEMNNILKRDTPENNRKIKVAWVSPFPPQKSGIANYSYNLIFSLRTFLDIELYYDFDKPNQNISSSFNVFPLSELPKNKDKYDEIVYHLGNSSNYHKNIYKMAWQIPGTIVLHDYNIHSFLRFGFMGTKEEHVYKHALEKCYGKKGLDIYNKCKSGDNFDILDCPLCEPIVERSNKVIVHHCWLKEQFPKNSNIYVIPHFANAHIKPTKISIDSFKKKHEISEKDVVISCVGFINHNKLPMLQLKVVMRLINDGYPVKLMFAGKTSEEVKTDLTPLLRKNAKENILITGYLEEKEYFAAISSSDILINLRNPSMGEASGTLMQSLVLGKPAIISNINQYKEFPDEICFKLSHDGNEEQMLYELLKMLICNPSLRSICGAKAEKFSQNFLNIDIISKKYKECIMHNAQNPAIKELILKLPFSKKEYKVQGNSKDKSILGTIEYNNGYYEQHVMNLLNKIIKPDFICLDIGANIGIISICLSALCKKVFSFEPSKKNYTYLKKNAKINKAKNITAINLGIYDKECETDFSYVKEAAGCSFMSETGIKEGENEKINCVRLDDWAIRNNLTRLDFIKLDVEGAEIKAIKGAREVIYKHKPDLIIEFNPEPMRRFFNENAKILYNLLDSIYPSIYLVGEKTEKLTKIENYKMLMEIIKEGKGWEDLYCSFRNIGDQN